MNLERIGREGPGREYGELSRMCCERGGRGHNACQGAGVVGARRRGADGGGIGQRLKHALSLAHVHAAVVGAVATAARGQARFISGPQPKG